MRRFAYTNPWNISSRNAPLAIAKPLAAIKKNYMSLSKIYSAIFFWKTAANKSSKIMAGEKVNSKLKLRNQFFITEKLKIR